MLFSTAHRPANCVLCAFFWYRSFFSPLVPSATRTRFQRALTVCLLLFIVCLSSLLFGSSSWSFLSSFSLVPPILSPVEASCLFIFCTTVLSLHLFPSSLVLSRLAFIAASFPRICGGWAFPKSRLAPRLSATTCYSVCTWFTFITTPREQLFLSHFRYCVIMKPLRVIVATYGYRWLVLLPGISMYR